VIEFEIENTVYQAQTLNALNDQLPIVRRIGAVLGDVMPSLAKFLSQSAQMKADGSKPSVEDLIGVIADFVEPVSKALNTLSDDDLDFVVRKCVGVTSVKQGSAYAKLMVNGQLMFADTSLITMLIITKKVLAANLAGFFSALPSLLFDQVEPLPKGP
jgi:hypothetical protein